MDRLEVDSASLGSIVPPAMNERESERAPTYKLRAALDVQDVQVLTITPALLDPASGWEDVIPGYGMRARHDSPYGDTERPDPLTICPCALCRPWATGVRLLPE